MAFSLRTWLTGETWNAAAVNDVETRVNSEFSSQGTRLTALEVIDTQATARVYNNANISVANSTITPLTFNSERWDDGSLHSTATNTGRLTAPVAGLYEIGACVRFAANATGYRYATIRLNGTTTIVYDMRINVGAGVETIIPVTTQYRLVIGDYVEVVVAQGSGGALNVEFVGNYSPEFWMTRIGS